MMRSFSQSDALFQDLLKFEKIAVGVSGGSDSLALLVMLSDWAEKNKKIVHAITVDHRLREASGNEARYVGDVCDKFGICHHTVRWDSDKPVTGLAEAARNARYRLMAEYCGDHNIKVLALGHTQDDQAETVLMRLARTKEESRGLSGMSAMSIYAPQPDRVLNLVRPLLDVKRARLREFLNSQSIGWIDDPTNEDSAYERVRARQVLANAPRFQENLIGYAQVMGQYREQVSKQAALFIASHCRRLMFHGVEVERAALSGQPRAVALLVMQALLSVVGGRRHLPPSKKVARILDARSDVSLSRVHCRLKGEAITLFRESRDIPSVCDVGNIPILWDGRLWISRRFATKSPLQILAGGDLDDEKLLRLEEEVIIDRGLEKFFANKHKSAVKVLPFVRYLHSETECGKLSVEPADISSSTEIIAAVGAFEIFCSSYDFSLREALSSLFTVYPGKM